jgi:hypothetical protein
MWKIVINGTPRDARKDAEGHPPPAIPSYRQHPPTNHQQMHAAAPNVRAAIYWCHIPRHTPACRSMSEASPSSRGTEQAERRRRPSPP